MRKSNYLVLGAAAVDAALLLVLWYHLGFNRIDSPLDLVLAIVWWVGIVAIAAILVRVRSVAAAKSARCTCPRSRSTAASSAWWALGKPARSRPCAACSAS